ncbi:MAG: cell envelope integrity protein CreD [Dysgonamonadaceae bacterium]|nr:cell envelope integrity protein CreD [Dysgonamonadaceae bacterium]
MIKVGKDKRELIQKHLLLLPEELNLIAETNVEKRKRGIYDVSVYRSDLVFSGQFDMAELTKTGIKPEQMQLDQARVIMGISDLKGIREGVVLQLGDNQLNFESGIPIDNLYSESTPPVDMYYMERDKPTTFPSVSTGVFGAGLNVKLDSTALMGMTQETIPFTIKLYLNGSEGFYITPIGKTTTAQLKSDWVTPSFGGGFLPESHNVTNGGFTANWKVIDLNRSFGQTINVDNATAINQMTSSVFGVKFIQIVDQYQQNIRSVKYAVLIILLTFVIVFFVEILKKKSVNPFQYLLVGLALVLFYSLLLSMSEVWGFNLAYIVAAVMTTALIVLHMSSILKNRILGLLIGALLAFLYIFVFILIQMESYALLVGSIVLFCILGVIMYFSKKLKI